MGLHLKKKTLIFYFKIFLGFLNPIILMLSATFLNLFSDFPKLKKNKIYPIISLCLIYIVISSFIGLNFRIGVYFLTLCIIFSITESEYEKNTLLLFSFLLVLFYLGDIYDNLFIKNSITKNNPIPDISLLLLVYFFDKKKIYFFLAVLFSVIIFKHISIISFIVFLRIFSFNLNFKNGIYLALFVPVITLISGLLGFSDGTSLLARFRGFMLVLEHFLADPLNIFFPGPFSGKKEEFFWPGDIGIIGSIYEYGLILVTFILLSAGFIIFSNRKNLSNIQLFLFGYFLLSYIGKVTTQPSLF